MSLHTLAEELIENDVRAALLLKVTTPEFKAHLDKAIDTALNEFDVVDLVDAMIYDDPRLFEAMQKLLKARLKEVVKGLK
jgi:hypothetical protein